MPELLPSKDAALFRQIIKCYESKQYKKGLKLCEQILRKNPKHGETIAMKGLITGSMGKIEEAFAIAKDALRHDMRSHVCWHVYGLLHRSEKNYEEAIKAYKMALKIEPDSQQILRDLALLQVQMRDWPGYVESRRLIMNGRPGLRQNWTALAIAHHMAGQYAEAEKVLDTYEGTLKDKGEISKLDLEHWEACLYKNMIIAESGDTERALKHLDSIAKKCVDRVAVMEARARYLLKLGRKEDAAKAYRQLIDRNPEKRDYFSSLEKAEEVNPTERGTAKALYNEYAAKYPKADAPRRIPLDFLEGDEFREAADAYLQAKLKKGVPSTFANIKALYADAAKRQIIFELAESYSTAQEKNGDITNGEASETARFRLWTLHFLGKHYDHALTRDAEKALEHYNKALELEPNTVEIMMGVARVYKHAGELQKAMEKMDEARNVDKSDRYINTKTAKYQLRNDHNEDALKTMSLFTRNDAAGGPLGDLIEMQCIWFITEDAESYLRQRKLGLALKRYQAIHDIFITWHEDQLDFHSFSLRKGQVRAYVDMLRWEDKLKSHPMFARAALGAISCYTLLANKPHLAHGPLQNGEEAKFDDMDAAEKKKALKKAKREQQKAQERADAAAAKHRDDKNKNAQVADTSAEAKKEDADPLGNSLAKTETPLVDAEKKWLRPLLDAAPDRVATQCAAADVYARLKSWRKAVDALKVAADLDREVPDVHVLSVQLRRTLDTLPEAERDAAAADALDTVIPKSTDLAAHNAEFLSRHNSSPAHVRAATRITYLLTPGPDVEKQLLATLDNPVAQLADALAGLTLLREFKVDDAAYVAKARTVPKFKDAPAFKVEP